MKTGARFLTRIRRRGGTHDPERFPWSLPLVRDFGELAFGKAVTFFAGENGCGKSTILEALAIGSGAVAIGGRSLDDDETLAASRDLADELIFTRPAAPRRKAFFRAEDAFGFTRRVQSDMRDLADLETGLGTDPNASPVAGARAARFIRGQRSALAVRYGDDVHARSHGETFLDILETRLLPQGLYFLDEPETPLSPTRVLALCATLLRCIDEGSQFFIATHSPLLMALPGADIFVLDGGRARQTAFEDVEHVRITRAFLEDPERYLRRLRDGNP